MLYPTGNKTNKWMKESACPFMATNYSLFKMIWVVKGTRLHTVTWEIIFFHILLYLLYFMLFFRLLHFVIFSVSGKEKDVLFILLENRNFRTQRPPNGDNISFLLSCWLWLSVFYLYWLASDCKKSWDI